MLAALHITERQECLMTSRVTPRRIDGPEQPLWFLELAPRSLRLQNAALRSLNPAVNFRQFRILVRINDGYQSLTQLSAKGTLSMSSLSMSIDSLVTKGLAAKSPSRDDGRVTILSITVLGRRLVAQGNKLLHQLSLEILQDVPQDQRADFERNITAVGDRVAQSLRSRQERKT